MSSTTISAKPLEHMSVVVVGHVDHGKSTVIGRLLADTGALPDGKIEQVKAACTRNSRPFEYAFLLDVLKDEQSQGITIDTARCFFKTQKRHYTIIDAPGHIEFLKNMITGASRADAALIVIDAHEGIRENSKRHGHMVSMLGITQVVVLVNKMDLVAYDKQAFEAIQAAYRAFLERFNLQPIGFIPISARDGVNMAARSSETPWYTGPILLDQLDALERPGSLERQPLRFPLQDIYKFTEDGDERRIFAGTIDAGSLRVGERVVFFPSGKRSTIKSVEEFNRSTRASAAAEEATGVTLDTQIYVKPGELIAREGDPLPHVSSRFRANLFWTGRNPMIREKKYKIKLGAARSSLRLVDVVNVLDASELGSVTNKKQVDRHDVAECILETPKPIAFDLVHQVRPTGQFVVVDNFEIAGAGIILESITDENSTLKHHVHNREFAWKGSAIGAAERAIAYGHGAKFIVFAGDDAARTEAMTMALEKQLFERKFKAYYLRPDSLMKGLDSDVGEDAVAREEHIRRLGELARILTGSGQIFITSLTEADEYDVRMLELLNKPNEIIVINTGAEGLKNYRAALDLSEGISVDEAVDRACTLLHEKKVILEYQI